jgi:hypothetical protein
MADFAANPSRGCKPFCDWSKEKRQRVYRRLVSIINTRIRHGFGLAIPKASYDFHSDEMFKKVYGKNHYVHAAKQVIALTGAWRNRYRIQGPTQYIFDRMSEGKGEIMAIFANPTPDLARNYGLEKDGYSIRDKAVFKPLQAADILAWQIYSHMKNVVTPGKDERVHTHPNFRLLRVRRSYLAEGQEVNIPMTLGFVTDGQIEDMVAKIKHYEKQAGV